jgi:hypothetical protein
VLSEGKHSKVDLDLVLSEGKHCKVDLDLVLSEGKTSIYIYGNDKGRGTKTLKTYITNQMESGTCQTNAFTGHM